jgi:hypothetical protein
MMATLNPAMLMPAAYYLPAGGHTAKSQTLAGLAF